MHGQERFATIDALRGIAAICVVLFHAGPGSPFTMPGGFLAVDLFFALSGFVIAHSYLDRLRAGMSLRQFMIRRIIRLWPMVIVGAGLGIALHGGHAGLLFLLPDWRAPQLFPGNPPFWSLLAELLVNFVFAAVVLNAARGILVLLLAASVMALGLAAGIPLADAGVNWASFPIGLARTVFSFGIGVALYALWRRRGIASAPSALALFPLLGMVAIFALVPRTGSLPGLLIIVLLIPLATRAAAQWELPWRRSAAWLGDISYPLYCIHMPIIALYPGESAWVMATVCITLAIAAWLLERLLERPARRLLAHVAQHNEARRLKPAVRPASA